MCANPDCRRHFELSVSKASLSKSGLLFCKRSCKDHAQKIHIGVSAIQPSHYRAEKDARGSYRARALELFGSICAVCGYKDVEELLDVHHINGDRSDNGRENLQVLCVWCHATKTRRLDPVPWTGLLNTGT